MIMTRGTQIPSILQPMDDKPTVSFSVTPMDIDSDGTQNINNDALFCINASEQNNMRNLKPWSRNPHYFKRTRIASSALLKMLMHAQSGGTLEVMGLVLGKLEVEEFVVLDCFALPVEGTETRVNAQAEANEYIISFLTLYEQSGNSAKVIGWYHSHPDYGCWLSGIDVSTQELQQQYQDPFIAIVVDPIRTMRSGHVDIGAFRTLPARVTAEDNGSGTAFPSASSLSSLSSNIPQSKIADFGVHAKHYYPLEVSFFTSSIDRPLINSIFAQNWTQSICSSSSVCDFDGIVRSMTDITGCLRALEGKVNGTNIITSRKISSAGKGAKDLIDDELVCECTRKITHLTTQLKINKVEAETQEAVFGAIDMK